MSYDTTKTDQVLLLHSSPYQEQAAIVRGFSRQYGIVSAVLRGVYSKTSKAGRLRTALQIGNLLEWQWRNSRASLAYLNQCDVIQTNGINDIKRLLCLSYINELLLYLLPEGQASEALFNAYLALLGALQELDDVEVLLREYERLLFSEMGWTIDFSWDNSRQEKVAAEQQYCLDPEQGVLLHQTGMQGLVVSGAALEKLAQRQYQCPETKRLAKTVHRMLINHHLAGRKLNSRRLYQQL